MQVAELGPRVELRPCSLRSIHIGCSMSVLNFRHMPGETPLRFFSVFQRVATLPASCIVTRREIERRVYFWKRKTVDLC
jgi:hypothetical protein